MPTLLKNVDYSIQGYHKKLVFDNKGDLTEVWYYKNYDTVNDTYSNLMVKETRTYTRGVSTLLERRDMLIEWGTNGKVSKETVKYYTPELGYKANKRARQNLIDRASMYLLDSIGLYDSKAFLKIITSEMANYVDGDIQPLLDVINSSSETYMTPTVKSTLDSILNISYAPT